MSKQAIKVGDVFEHPVYGEYTVTKYDGASKVTVVFTNTGFTTTKKATNIRCGMVKDKLHLPNYLLPGTKVTLNSGDAVIKEKHSAGRVLIEFVDTGYITSARFEDIRTGSVYDRLKPTVHGVGYLGVGEHKAHGSAAYKRWVGMLERCYSDAWHKNKPTYKDCTVCDEWKDFQVFAEWYYRNVPTHGRYHLDKDILVDGNKVYSPSTCMFVTQSENTVKAHAKKYIVYKGSERVDVYNMAEYCRDNNLCKNKMSALVNGRIISHKGYTLNGI